MYKNQLQELAQRSCFNLPSYACIREGPDHAPRFKAIVNFNGESFESPTYCLTLRQAEHAAAEIALNSLSSHSLAARILDETGVYKNLLQEISQRVGAPLPHYTTCRSGLGHQPVFTGKVELAGITFTGEPAKNKKQAEKNAALASWQSLKQLAQQSGNTSSELETNDELEQVTIARALLNYRLKEKMTNPSSFPLQFPQTFRMQNPRPPSPQRPPVMSSKILPLICPKRTPPRVRPPSLPTLSDIASSLSQIAQKFPGFGAPPYIPIRHGRAPCRGIAPPVTIRNSVPCYSAPSLSQSSGAAAPPVMRSAPPVTIRNSVPCYSAPPPFQTSGAAAPPVMRSAPPVRIAPPVSIRQSVPVFSAPPIPKVAPTTRITHLQEPSIASDDQMEAIQKSISIQSKNVPEDQPPSLPSVLPRPVMRVNRPPFRTAPPVCIRQAVPVCAAPPPRKQEPSSSSSPTVEERTVEKEVTENPQVVEKLEQLKL